VPAVRPVRKRAGLTTLAGCRTAATSPGASTATDTDPVRRWDDNLSALWLNLQSGSFSRTELAVPVGVFLLLFLGILLVRLLRRR
jgi:hypothetical protein